LFTQDIHPIQDPRFASNIMSKKTTPDGTIVLDPQPENCANDPLNWSRWKKTSALLSLSIYCMLGSGTSSVLDTGCQVVASSFNIEEDKVALTAGLYMLGAGIGGIVTYPVAILYGKRLVFLVTALLFTLTSICCATSSNFTTLLVARFLQGVAVSPSEILPSTVVSEIFFLHERAFRIGVFTSLQLCGKNLIPLVSADVIGSIGWKCVFWILAFFVGLVMFALFLFLPETLWDRTEQYTSHSTQQSTQKRMQRPIALASPSPYEEAVTNILRNDYKSSGPESQDDKQWTTRLASMDKHSMDGGYGLEHHYFNEVKLVFSDSNEMLVPRRHLPEDKYVEELDKKRNVAVVERSDTKYMTNTLHMSKEERETIEATARDSAPSRDKRPAYNWKLEEQQRRRPNFIYTEHWRFAPKKTFTQTLCLCHGRLSSNSFFSILIRPLTLFSYPAVVWSALVYSLSVGWLITLSESLGLLYQSRSSYNFTAYQTGLVFFSPFVGGALGTVVAGKLSDWVIRVLAQRNGGVYEPEFRLFMAIPIAITTVMGLLGFGWSIQERDAWIVPTIFFGIVSFGSGLGAVTATTFCMDSHSQFTGEALVILTFSKNVFHGLAFSLFFDGWLESNGSKTVFTVLGVIQLLCMLLSIPMYIYGKRTRAWATQHKSNG
jgi:MFS family permease